MIQLVPPLQDVHFIEEGSQVTQPAGHYTHVVFVAEAIEYPKGQRSAAVVIVHDPSAKVYPSMHAVQVSIDAEQEAHPITMHG